MTRTDWFIAGTWIIIVSGSLVACFLVPLWARWNRFRDRGRGRGR